MKKKKKKMKENKRLPERMKTLKQIPEERGHQGRKYTAGAMSHLTFPDELVHQRCTSPHSPTIFMYEIETENYHCFQPPFG